LEFEKSARDFLLSKSDNSGNNETHLFFLQNLAAGSGSLPEGMNEKTNNYLLRAIDGTPVYSPKNVAMYSKLGPIAFFSTILPSSLANSNDSKVTLKGTLKTAQHLKNERINSFSFIKRPNEVFSNYKISDKQSEKIKKDIIKDPDRAAHSMSFYAAYGDSLMKDILEKK